MVTRRCTRPSRLAPSMLLTAVTLVISARATAQPAPTDDRRASVAVVDFTIAALVPNASNWAPLGKGMPQILMTELAANRDLRIVERERIQTVLDELKLTASALADPATAARVGKLVGARYIVTGAATIDPRNRIRLDVHGIRTETSVQEYADNLLGPADDVLELVARIGETMSKRFDPTPFDAPSAGRSGGPGRPTRDGLRLAMLIGNAVELQDRHNVDSAKVLVRQALAIAPDYPSAKALLTSLEREK